ncbi:MAG: nucleotidyltransferase domain-containing protein [Lachnospiraceae bacterium]|nr:nucleotidyltransferase domain-containing protein [Lachnospiraceae bacterium]
MPNDIFNVLEPLPQKLQHIYGDKLKAVILYGSYARGTANEESDVDIAILVDGSDDELNSYDKSLTDVTADFIAENQCKWLFSIIPIRFSRYNEWKDTLPFYKSIEKEGIPLYVS